MGKHILWSIVVLLLGVIAGYVFLTVKGYPDAADALGGAVGLALVLAFFAAMIFT